MFSFLFFGLIIVAVYSFVSAISALAMHWAAQLADAAFPDYKNTFKMVFIYYMVLLLAGVVFAMLNIKSLGLGVIVMLLAFAALMYVLIESLGIEGGKNSFIFVVMSVVLSMALRFFISALVGI